MKTFLGAFLAISAFAMSFVVFPNTLETIFKPFFLEGVAAGNPPDVIKLDLEADVRSNGEMEPWASATLLNNSYFALAPGIPFQQNWTDITQVAANDDWIGVSAMLGFLGNGLVSTPGVNPQTILADETVTTLDVIADQVNPNTLTTGGVGEFHLANPVVALQGSSAADAPSMQVRLNTLSCPFPANSISVTYNIRDIDGSLDNAVQPVALHYRASDTGNYINIPSAFVADATTGPSLATLVTPVSVTLPAGAQGQSIVHLRFMTSDAAGSDEWVGIDDINVTCVAAVATTPVMTTSPANLAFANRAVNTQSLTQSVTISNQTGTAALNWTASIAGTDPTQFSIVGASGGSVAAGGSANVSVRFNPTSAGSKSAVLTVSGDDPANTSDIIGLSGTGFNGVDFASVQFPKDINPITSGDAATIFARIYEPGVTDISNDSTGQITGELGYGAAGSSPGSAGWTWVPAPYNTGYNCILSGACDLDEHVGNLTAPVPGTYSYGFRFSLDGGTNWAYAGRDNLVDVDATTGWSSMTVTAAAPFVQTLSANSITATGATLNGNAAPRGSATTGHFRYSSTNPGACSDSFGTRAPASGGTALGSTGSSVAFDEDVSGLVTGTTYYYCAIAENSVGPSFGTVQQFVPVANPVMSTSPANLAFGNQAINTNSATQDVTISNTGGAAPLNWSASVTGSHQTHFSIVGPASGIIPINGSAAVSVRFNPTAVGDKTANLLVQGDDSANPSDGIPLTGNGTLSVTYTVNKIDDTNDGVCDADCSLREAVAAANANAGADVITFDAAVFPAGGPAKEIILGGTEIEILDDVTITGPGADVLTVGYAVDAVTRSRIFSISPATVTISGMTLRGGNSQGARQPGDGGAILARNGALTMNRVHLLSNDAPAGGALYLQLGDHRFINSTCSGNTTTSNGGCVFAIGASLEVVNSTIDGNSASFDGGGIYSGNSFTTIASSTITENTAAINGGGVHNVLGNMSIGSSIIAGNAANSAGPEIYNDGGFTSNGYNLVGVAAGDAEDTQNPVTYAATDILNQPPLLGLLGNNGGPTPTRLPQPGSPVIDKGRTTAADADQRGFHRNADFASVPNATGGDGTDIGSVELLIPTAAPAFISGRVTTADGYGLRQAYVTVQGGDIEGTRTVATGTFGYYRFEGLTAGQTYFVSVRSRRHNFANATRLVNLSENVADVNFVAGR